MILLPWSGLKSRRACTTKEGFCRYFVRYAAKPKGRLALALAVNVGSVAEEDHEQGVAHILEHLAFNATEVGVRPLAEPWVP